MFPQLNIRACVYVCLSQENSVLVGTYRVEAVEWCWAEDWKSSHWSGWVLMLRCLSLGGERAHAYVAVNRVGVYSPASPIGNHNRGRRGLQKTQPGVCHVELEASGAAGAGALDALDIKVLDAESWQCRVSRGLFHLAPVFRYGPLLLLLLSVVGDASSIYSFSYLFTAYSSHGVAELVTLLVLSVLNLALTFSFGLLQFRASIKIEALQDKFDAPGNQSPPGPQAKIVSLLDQTCDLASWRHLQLDRETRYAHAISLVINLLQCIVNIRLLASFRVSGLFLDYYRASVGFATSIYLSLLSTIASWSLQFAVCSIMNLLSCGSIDKATWYLLFQYACELWLLPLYAVGMFAFGRLSYDLQYYYLAVHRADALDAGHSLVAYGLCTAVMFTYLPLLMSHLKHDGTMTDFQEHRALAYRMWLLNLAPLIVGPIVFLHSIPSLRYVDAVHMETPAFRACLVLILLLPCFVMVGTPLFHFTRRCLAEGLRGACHGCISSFMQWRDKHAWWWGWCCAVPTVPRPSDAEAREDEEEEEENGGEVAHVAEVELKDTTMIQRPHTLLCLHRIQ